METGEIEYQNVKFTFSIQRISTTLYNTYQLLYCIGHIQITSNYNTIEVEGDEIEYKNESSHSL